MLLNCGAGEDSWAPWTARRSNQLILKEINPKYSLEGLMLKLQYIGHLMQRADSLEKSLMLGRLKQKEKGVAEDEAVTQHHQLSGHEPEQILGDSEGQKNLSCSSAWVTESWAWPSNWTTNSQKAFQKGENCLREISICIILLSYLK